MITIEAPNKGDKKYSNRHKCSMPFIFHLVGAMATLFTPYILIDASFDEPGVQFILLNNSILILPYLYTVIKMVLKKDFFIEVKEEESGVAISYIIGEKVKKRVFFEFSNIKNIEVGKDYVGAAQINRLYIEDIKGRKKGIAQGLVPFDLRGLSSPYYCYVLEADLQEACRGNLNGN